MRATTSTVSVLSLNTNEYRVEAIASSGGREYRVGYDIIRHRDLETRYLYRDATTRARHRREDDPRSRRRIRDGDRRRRAGGWRSSGKKVQLLGERIATADLSRFNTIITGTRAYAVREDLKPTIAG